ncbi:hypothetical protein TrLO_g6112 [Triparma laevis f. longispina]|uniref:protein-ribulosamine 3-kinase n=1 Tax=Triparma laevis f. longispina TaxID=1714387 RepID=A0A9W7A5F9_9STRA|nr:hypothetical protein TrLO_g6112 [Triparma laevis f. longispina]
MTDPFGVLPDPNDDTPKYRPSLNPDDPIVSSLQKALKSSRVKSFELIDSRWNGNEVMKYECEDDKVYFVKMNRVEDPSVFVSEGVSLSALAKTKTIKTPIPLHIGKLPKVGDIGPGSFMVLEYLPLVPFGSMRPDNQVKLAQNLAELHSSKVHDELHKGRFGFPTSNFLAVTPLNNTWCGGWSEFFSRRLNDQLNRLHTEKAYGPAVLPTTNTPLDQKGTIILNSLNLLLGSDHAQITPSLIHGDLWVGNTGATKAEVVVFDPAACFAHSEFELAIMNMFGGFEDTFWNEYYRLMPKAEGFETRAKLYAFYHYLNQLNLFGDSTVAKQCDDIATDLVNTLNEINIKNEFQ